MSQRDSSPRTLILLSVVMPGLGQVVQRRWLSAAIHGIGSTLLATVVLIRAVRALAATVRFALDFADAQAPTPPAMPVRAILVPLVAFLVLYLTNLIDIALTTRHAAPEVVATPPPLNQTGGRGS